MGPKGIEDLGYKNPQQDSITKGLLNLRLCQYCKRPLRKGPASKKYCDKLCRWKAWSGRNPRITTNPIIESK